MTDTVGYRWYVGDLRTGRLGPNFPLTSTSWSVVMDDAGALAGTLALSDPSNAELNPRVTAQPARCFLAVAYQPDDGEERFLQAGPIWTHGYDAGSQQLQIGAAGIWSLFDHRKILPVLAAGQPAGEVTSSWGGLSLATIAKRLIQQAFTHTGGSVPIVLPPDELGTNARTYPGADLAWIGSALKDLVNTDGGPEIQFVPRRRSDDPRFLEWVMRVGTTEAPMLTQGDGDDWIWDTGVGNSSVSPPNVAIDGASVGSRAWAKGASLTVGAFTSQMISEADSSTLIDAGFPLLEVEDASHDSETDQAALDGDARGLLQRSGQPGETWNFTVHRDAEPTVGDYTVGDWARVDLSDLPGRSDPYLRPGSYRARITQFSGDDSTSVALQMMPTIGGL